MKKTVLLVDDDPTQLKLTRALLADAGFEVRTARGGVEALAAAKATRPDAIVSDVLMRDCDGFRLCQQVRAESGLATVPVVLVSAHFQSERDKSLATAVGANGFAERSPDFSRELAAVRSALGEVGLTPARGDTGALYAERVSEQLSQLLDKARAADMRYRTLFEIANDGIAVLDAHGVVIESNRRMAELVGRPRESCTGLHVATFAAPGHAERNTALFLEALRGVQIPPVSLARPDGTVVQVKFSISGIEVDGQQLMLAIGRDVTADLEAAQQLAASEEKYRRLVENLVDVAWSSRLSDGALMLMTANVQALTGFTADEVTAGGAGFWAGRIHPDDQARVDATRNKMRESGAMDLEYRWRHRDGSWRWFRARARVTTQNGVSTVDGLISDITARKQLEDEFRQAQKMEALGQLTGGVAHDFNNLLCVILANSEMLMRSLAQDDARCTDVADVREAAERAAGLTRQLLAFSRKQVLKLSPLDLGAVMCGVEKLLRRVIGEDVKLDQRAKPGLAPVLADAGQLEQVLMNLVVNARDAMPGGGSLTLDAHAVTLRGSEVKGVPAGEWICLTVSDTGCGMDAKTQRQIFEPFFTTKPVGKGTGLGLSTCYGIVTQCGGHLTVDSAPGRGSTFSVWLPRAKEVDAAREERQSTAARGGTETVLVVEDDEGLRRTVTRALSRLGYTVLAARNGEEAERLFRENRSTVRLVLSDMVLPDKGGLETIAQLRADAFAGQVVFMSGYVDRPELNDVIARADVTFIQKPFQRDVLARTVRQAIDGGAP